MDNPDTFVPGDMVVHRATQALGLVLVVNPHDDFTSSVWVFWSTECRISLHDVYSECYSPAFSRVIIDD